MNQPSPLALSTTALFLDFDGTLVELADRPDRVVVPDTLPPLLRTLLQRMDGALAVVTGRGLSAVDAFLKPLILPAAGLHGAELRLDREAAAVTAAAEDMRRVASRLHAVFGAEPDLLIEDKGAAVTLHYRQAPEREAEAERAMHAAVEGTQLSVISGKFCFEAKLPGVSKGSAVRAFSVEPSFRGRRPIFIGDDTTDEDGFRAAHALGGFGIKVGEGSSVARFRLDNPQAVLDWLTAAI